MTTAPATETLTDVWREVLRDQEASPGTSFFDLGGSSLTALRLRALIKARCELDVDLAMILDNPTPAGLSAALSDTSRS